MAFVIVSEPLEYAPARNRLEFRVSSGNVSRPKHKYVFETFVDGVSAGVSKLPARPDGTCAFDASRVVCAYLSHSYAQGLTAITAGAESESCKYKVVFTEEYVPVGGTETQSFAGNSGTDKFAWLAAASWEESKNFAAYVARVKPSAANGTLSNAADLLGPKSYATGTASGTYSLAYPHKNDLHSIAPNEKRVLTLMSRGDTSYSYKPDRFAIATRVKAATPLFKLFVMNLSVSTDLTDAKYQFLRVPAGIAELNAMSWSTTTIPQGYSSTIKPEEDDYYVAYFANSTSSKFTHKPVGFDIVCAPQYERVTAIYKALDGGWWYVPFEMKNAKNLSVAKAYKGDLLLSGHTDASRAISVTDIYARESITLNTAWLKNDFQILELQEMLHSPEIYLAFSDGKTVPVTVSDGSYQLADRAQNGASNMTVTFDFAYEKNSLL